MKLYEICFSPTGGTKQAANRLAKGLSEEILPVDLTDSSMDFSAVSISAEDAALIAVPSYGGRVPEPAVKRLGALKGNGAKAVLVCVYGNRAYEDTLIELADAAKEAGFQVIAAVSAVAEHSIVRQIAAGRPDSQDEAQLTEFAAKIRAKLESGSTKEPALPGNRPYKKRGGSGMVPKPDMNCTSCGLCARKCPVQAIDRMDPKKVDEAACISCMRCVSVCPQNARSADPVKLEAVHAMLNKVCGGRKEGELFL